MKRWKRLVIAPVVCAVAAGILMAAAAEPSGAEDAPAAAKTAKPALPSGYKLLYEQKFDKPTAIGGFEFSDLKQWKIFRADKVAALEFGGKGRYKPKVRSPLIIGLISDRVFGDFILEADLLQTGRNYGHRDMCLFFGFTDKSKYYYCHMASKADNHAHNIFIVNDKPRTKIALKTTKGIEWGKDKWHKVRLERKASDGTIKIFFDNMTMPIMVAKDTTFKTGYVGFGSFDDSGRIDNIRIWGPKAAKKASKFFPRKPPSASSK